MTCHLFLAAFDLKFLVRLLEAHKNVGMVIGYSS